MWFFLLGRLWITRIEEFTLTYGVRLFNSPLDRILLTASELFHDISKKKKKE